MNTLSQPKKRVVNALAAFLCAVLGIGIVVGVVIADSCSKPTEAREELSSER